MLKIYLRYMTISTRNGSCERRKRITCIYQIFLSNKEEIIYLQFLREGAEPIKQSQCFEIYVAMR